MFSCIGEIKQITQQALFNRISFIQMGNVKLFFIQIRNVISLIQRASLCCHQGLTTRVWRQGCIFSIYPFSLHGESDLIKHLIAQTGSRVWSGGEMLSNILAELVDRWEPSSE